MSKSVEARDSLPNQNRQGLDLTTIGELSAGSLNIYTSGLYFTQFWSGERRPEDLTISGLTAAAGIYFLGRIAYKLNQTIHREEALRSEVALRRAREETLNIQVATLNTQVGNLTGQLMDTLKEGLNRERERPTVVVYSATRPRWKNLHRIEGRSGISVDKSRSTDKKTGDASKDLKIEPTDPSDSTMERLQALFRQLPDETPISALSWYTDRDGLSRELTRIIESSKLSERTNLTVTLNSLKRNAEEIGTLGNLRLLPPGELTRYRNLGPARTRLIQEMLGKTQEVNPIVEPHASGPAP